MTYLYPCSVQVRYFCFILLQFTWYKCLQEVKVPRKSVLFHYTFLFRSTSAMPFPFGKSQKSPGEIVRNLKDNIAHIERLDAADKKCEKVRYACLLF